MTKNWKLLSPAPQNFLTEHPELPVLAAGLLYHRNIRTQEQIDEFLNPDYSQDVHDPFLFRDMEKAVERIYKAINSGEKIIVHGDYDADGVCGAVIIISTLKTLGAQNVDVFLPHREIDGYGLNKNTIQKFAEEKINLIITCDCGISNLEEIVMANEKGMDVIITDHHSVPETLPPAYAIIHPKVKDETYPDKGLAGGGVAFKLMQGLLKKNSGEKPSDGWEKWLLDLVAIATVADMVPLVGESRTLVKYGLVVLNKTKRIGLQKLLLEARLLQEDGNKKRELTADTISFQIAPRLNAAGRMNHANTAYNLMITEDNDEAAELARELNENNEQRQKTTEELMKEAVNQIEKTQKDEPILFARNDEWPGGIIGLAAGKLKDKYYKPSIVITRNESEIIGSGRSVEEFNLIEALQELSGYFDKFGGHPMACGFTIKNESQLEEFKTKLKEKFKEKTAGRELKPALLIDAEVNLDEINWELYGLLEKFEPFGQTNPKPKYLAHNLTITGLEPVGKDRKHLRIMVKHNSQQIKKTIGWNLCDENNCHCTDWSKALKIGDKIDLVFEIDVNQWNGNRELQLTIVDLKKL